MTTVVYRDGIMVGDSMVQLGANHTGSTQKVFKFDDGTLVGVAGILPHCQAFVRHLNDPESHPCPPMADVSAMVVLPDNDVIYEFEGMNLPTILKQDYAAIGSGTMMALAFMRAGYSAEDAMSQVVGLNIHTSGPLHVESRFLPRRLDFDWLLVNAFSPLTTAPDRLPEISLEDDDDDDIPIYTCDEKEKED